MIDIRNLSFITSDTGATILRNVNLSIDAGERIGIVGESGSGKTTLGYFICGVHRKALYGTCEGSLRIEGDECIDTGRPGFAGILFQNPDVQLFCNTVWEEISTVPRYSSAGRREIEDSASKIIEMLDLNSYKREIIKNLSSGLKHRVAIASILAADPKVVLFDEPTNFLDPTSSDNLFRTLNTWCGARAITVVVIEHDYERLSSWASRIVEMNAGTVSDSYSPEKKRTVKRAGLVFPSRPEFNHTRPVLEIDNLHFGYSKNSPLLKGLTTHFHEGEIVALLGANGSGKTTLLKLMKGLLKPVKGEISLNSGNRLMDSVGLVFQNPDDQIFAHAVGAECGYLLENRKVPAKERKKKVGEALATLGLSGLSERLPFTLSFGEKRRLTIASVLVGDPDFICLDEPTVALDLGNVAILRKLFMKLVHNGKTIVFSTHDFEFAQTVATRCITLRNGEIASDEFFREDAHGEKLG